MAGEVRRFCDQVLGMNNFRRGVYSLVRMSADKCGNVNFYRFRNSLSTNARLCRGSSRKVRVVTTVVGLLGRHVAMTGQWRIGVLVQYINAHHGGVETGETGCIIA